MFFDVFNSLCQSKGVSCKRAVLDIGLSNSLPTKWKKTGATPNGETLNKVASYFGVSVNYLLGNEEKQNTPTFNKKDERDIAKDLERLRTNLESGEGLMFDGDPLSDEAKESILAAMEIGLKMAKAKNKEKYTPKKYRKDAVND